MTEQPLIPSPSAKWRVVHETAADLPRLAWLARIEGPLVRVWSGRGVRRENEGAFEGTWSGDATLAGATRSATVFGSGMVCVADELVVVTPAHTLEAVYHTRSAAGDVVISNSLVAVLEATGRELRKDELYPRLFSQVSRGIAHASIRLPVDPPGEQPVSVQFYENLAISRDGTIRVALKPSDEPPFESFASYRDRLVSDVASAFANGREYEPVATISSGYDSAASAAVGARAGCQQAVTFTTGWPWRGYHGTQDSGERTAQALGMTIECFERLAYLDLDEAPEAEFLATGMSGEDVVFRSMERALDGKIVLTGFWGGAAWRGYDRRELSRLDLSGASLGEFRLRTGFVHLPVPYIGGLQQQTMVRLRKSPEMRPFSVGGRYDEPFARRLAEEAGVRRGAFGVQKLAVSQKIHSDGVAALSASARASFEAFAGPDALTTPPRRPITRADRLALRLAKGARMNQLAESIGQRRRDAVHIEPVLGSLLLRWAIEHTRPRYAALRGLGR